VERFSPTLLAHAIAAQTLAPQSYGKSQTTLPDILFPTEQINLLVQLNIWKLKLNFTKAHLSRLVNGRKDGFYFNLLVA
jgi:hypothetical protein